MDDIRNRFRGYNAPGQPVYRPRSEPAPRPVARPQVAKPARSKRSRKVLRRIIISLLSLFLVAGAGIGGFWLYQKHPWRKKNSPAAPAAQSNTKVAQQVPSATIRMVATGDTLAYNSINAAAKKPDGSYDYSPMLVNIKPLLSKADIRYCDEASPVAGDQFGVSGFPSFNAPFALSKALEDAGCNLVNLASDHTNDKGQPAINALVSYWDGHKNILATSGANRSAEEQTKIRYFTVDSIKFAFLSYVTVISNKQVTPFGVNLYSDALAQSQLAEANKNAQYVIVGIQWGNENSADITPDQDRIAQQLADNKASVVIGHGPHVLQPSKIMNGPNGHQTLVWYSLGNFLNSQTNTDNLFSCMAVMSFESKNSTITNPGCLPLYMHYEWTADQKQSQSEAALLARHNFVLFPLDQATDPLAKSLNSTTVAAQQDHIKAIITKFVPVKMLTTADY